MAWGALVKSVAKGAIKKKAKKKGAEIAKNITNKKESSNQTGIVVREKSTTLAPILGGGDTPDTSVKKPSTSKSPLDRIDSALLDIMNTLKRRRKLILAKSRKSRVQADKEKKGKREGILESMKKSGKKMLGNVKAAATGWWEKLQRFLLMTMLGALVTTIMDNWKSIKAQIDKVVKFVQDLWKFMEPVITPLIEGLKWVVKQWSEMGSELMGKSNDNKEIGKETDQLSKDLKDLEKIKKDVDGNFKEAEQGIKDKRNEKFDDLAKKTGLDSGVSPDNEEQPEKSRDQVEQEVVEKIDGSGIESKLEEFKGKIEEINVEPAELDTSKMKKYETGASPVTETGPAIVHKGEVIIPAPVVKQVGGSVKIENIINMMQSSGEIGNIKTMMQSSSKKIKENPLKVISVMEEMSRQSAPIGEQLPAIINKPIMEKVEKTLVDIKEQTEYEDPSGTTVFIPVPTPSQPQMGSGGGGGETTVILGESGKAALNRYVNAVIQKALY